MDILHQHIKVQSNVIKTVESVLLVPLDHATEQREVTWAREKGLKTEFDSSHTEAGNWTHVHTVLAICFVRPGRAHVIILQMVTYFLCISLFTPITPHFPLPFFTPSIQQIWLSLINKAWDPITGLHWCPCLWHFNLADNKLTVLCTFQSVVFTYNILHNPSTGAYSIFLLYLIFVSCFYIYLLIGILAQLHHSKSLCLCLSLHLRLPLSPSVSLVDSRCWSRQLVGLIVLPISASLCKPAISSSN